MKKGAALALVLCLLAGGCRDEGFDMERMREAYGQAASITAEADITTHSGVLADYVISFVRQDGVSTVTLAEPESLRGISARTYEGRAEIEYDDVAIEMLLPPVSGFVPADALAGVLDDLAGGVPVDWCVESDEEGERVAMTFERETGGYAARKRVWVDRGTMAVTRAEFYLDGQMVMTMAVRNLVFSQEEPAASENGG